MAKPAALRAIPDDELFNVPKVAPTGPPPETAHDLQAAVEGVPTGDVVEFYGEQYRIADRIGLMPLMRFAHAARKGVSTDDMEGLAAVYDMLRDCLEPGEWPRFEQDATDKKADADDLLKVVQQTIELLTARPTRRPSGSSDGPSATSASSTGSSPSPVNQPGSDLVTVDELYRRAGGL